MEPDDVNESLCELKDLNRVAPPTYKHNVCIGWEYGFTPKFVRMQVLHELLFYLVHDFTEDNLQITTDEWLSNHVTKEELKDLPTIYRHEIGWKMFIPPLSEHESVPKGWALFTDVLLRIPLSLFVKIYRVRYIIPELTDYLNHPVKKHFLIKYLPKEIRAALLYKKSYLTTIYENLWRLCYIGLLQFDRIKCSDKFPQLLIYLNRHAVLYDTTTSSTGYNQVSTLDSTRFSHLKQLSKNTIFS